jgi:hypothetical protein
MDENDLTDAERRALRQLPAETPLPPDLEDRVVEALRGRGLLATKGAASGRSSRVLRLAGAAAVFAAGLGTGLFVSRARAPALEAGSLYLLLLHPGPEYAEGGPADEAARVAEYAAWAGELRRRGKLVQAERLHRGAHVLHGGAAVPGEGPQGFFLVRARDLEEAEAIARTCPHLRHGGRVAVQAVDPT